MAVESVAAEPRVMASTTESIVTPSICILGKIHRELTDWKDNPAKRQARNDQRLNSVVEQLATIASADGIKHVLCFSTYDPSFILDLARYYGFEMPKAANAKRPNKSEVVDEFIKLFLKN